MVKAEDSMTEKSWFQTPAMETIFSGIIHLDQSLEHNLSGIVACVVIPQNGSVGFDKLLAYKIQLHGTE